jgi:hypothetical protein
VKVDTHDVWVSRSTRCAHESPSRIHVMSAWEREAK